MNNPILSWLCHFTLPPPPPPSLNRHTQHTDAAIQSPKNPSPPPTLPLFRPNHSKPRKKRKKSFPESRGKEKKYANPKKDSFLSSNPIMIAPRCPGFFSSTFAHKPQRTTPTSHPIAKNHPEDGQNDQENDDDDFFVVVWWFKKVYCRRVVWHFFSFFSFFNFVSGFRAHHSPLFDAFFYNGAGSCQGREDTTRARVVGGEGFGCLLVLVYCVFCQKGISIEVERRLIQFVLGPGIWDRGETAANCCLNDLWICYFALWRRRIFARKVWKRKKKSLPNSEICWFVPSMYGWMGEKSREPFDQRGEIFKIRKPRVGWWCSLVIRLEIKRWKTSKEGKDVRPSPGCIVYSPLAVTSRG